MSNSTIEEHGKEDTSYQPPHHTPIMVKEVVECLQPEAEGTYVDATLGMGGHARALLKKIGQQGRLLGLDKDKRSLEIAQENLKEFSHQCDFVHEHFCHLDRVLKEKHIHQVDGILLDLGISSFQLDSQDRGFSFRLDGPLDMRINQESKLTAFDLVNSLSENEIARILRDYCQERYHQRITRHIVKSRSLSMIKTTKDLREIIIRSLPRGRKHERIHPATRSFQALRIAVNR